MKAFANLLRWQFVVLNRNNLIAVSIAVTAIYTLIFFAIRGLGDLEKALTLLIYNDPAIIGLFFVGLSIIMEKNEFVFQALFVSPMNHHAYLISKILALSIVGTLCALGMVLAVYGISINFFYFLFGAFFTTTLFGIVGVFLVSYTTEFLSFMLRSIPILFALSLPLLNYFEVTSSVIFYFTPLQGSLNLLINSYHQPVMAEVWYGFLSSIFWICVFYVIAFRVFKRRLLTT